MNAMLPIDFCESAPAASARRFLVAVGTVLMVNLKIFAADNAADWPPLPDCSNTNTQSVDGRVIECFTHGCSQWGCKDSRQTHFFLVHPKKGGENAPLCVVLHSANRSALDYLDYFFLNRNVDPADRCDHIPDDFYTLFLDSNNAEWWGWSDASHDRNKYSKEPTPAEKRVLASVEWVAAKFAIDRNRIYLTGTSMGGCGSLGIGLPHGDVFAAVRVFVPAGTEYVSCRMGLAPAPAADATKAQQDAWLKTISPAGRADPPPVVDLSARNDSWSKDQGTLLNAARDGRFSLFFGWGNFGHTSAFSSIGKYPRCATVLALPWMEIRKNVAYPVFTHALTDQRPPWSNKPDASDDTGQINGYFRWSCLADTSSDFAMRLWLEHPVADSLPPGAPNESVADITFRRVQHFKVEPNKNYEWRLIRSGETVASGVILPDADGLLTIPKATITIAPAELCLKPR